MERKRELPKLVIFGVLTAVTAFVWVGFEVYRAYTVKADPVVPPEVIQSLDPNLDLLILEGLVNKVYLEDEEIGVVPVSSPEPEPEAVQEIIEEVEDQELPEDILEILVQEDQATESGQTQ